MPTMGSYCKAYEISEFRKYVKWNEKCPLQPPTDENGEPVADEEPYLFLQENFTVTDGIFLDENIVFDDVTPEWEHFCREQLQFTVPDLTGGPADQAA